MMHALFALLEQRQLAQFALRRVTFLMESAVLVPPEFKLELYTNYLESLPRAMHEVQRGSEKHFDLLLHLLKSMRTLLQRRTRQQQQTLRHVCCGSIPLQLTTRTGGMLYSSCHIAQCRTFV